MRQITRGIGAVALAVLVGSSMVACNASTGTPTAAVPVPAATHTFKMPVFVATTPAAPTATPAPTLAPPAAPTNAVQLMALNTTDAPDPGDVEGDYSWTAPAGQVDGYYFFIMGTYVGVPAPSTTCDSSWQKLPGNAATHREAVMEAAHPSYICAFNAAGTSPTVKFQIKFGPGA